MESIKTWWATVPDSQRKGLVVLAIFVAAAMILSLGVVVGSFLAKVL